MNCRLFSPLFGPVKPSGLLDVSNCPIHMYIPKSTIYRVCSTLDISDCTSGATGVPSRAPLFAYGLFACVAGAAYDNRRRYKATREHPRFQRQGAEVV